jgi:glutathione S-transferase
MKTIEALRLYHYPLCPFSRKVRMFCYENDIFFNLVQEDFWKERENFLKLNPFGEVPFLVAKLSDEENNNTFFSIQGSGNILIYLSKKTKKDLYLIQEKNLKEDELLERQLEVGKIINWFDNKFYKEVLEIILEERVYSLMRGKNTNVQFLDIARKNLTIHFEYFVKIINEKNFFASEYKTFADLVAASHISVLDYLGEINWQEYPILKDWYCILKSQPSFHEILADTIPEIKPSLNYQRLDF